MKKTILEARQEVSRQEILGAAKRLFAEQGVRATSLAKLAEELGITKAALYYYFASKQEIVVEAVRANVSDFGADVMGPIPEGLSAGEHLEASLERKVQRAERDGPLDLRFFYTVMLEELDVPEVERVYQEFFAEGRAQIRATIEEGRRRGDFRSDVDLDTVLDVLAGTVLGIDILWLNAPKSVDLRAAYKLAVEQTLTTLRAAPAPAPGGDA